ncbi:M23/M56 family metallopeptidase [Pseudoalteromonas sp. G4]|uniref:M23/M56 family metallopeptidase n=1 Tax=Pseudoalteromonas sp. G4 TaxID=2992761 RepID=UPI00237E3142|nr:M23/M56 family metallopeptidase [Pseudoalteromonas sp. G4]MDE3271877.1 M23/M56 family metallopeptidase [Pseudoalteromonas sp. G4]
MMLLITLLGWVVVTYLVAYALRHISIKERISPNICLAAFVLSLGIFLPNIEWIEVGKANFMWINDKAQQQLTLVHDVVKQTHEHSTLPLETFLLTILAVTSVFRLYRVFKRYFQAKQLIANAVPFTQTKIPCVVMPINQSPFVMGFIKPTLVLPQYFLHLSKAQQDIILAHELTHIANRDHLRAWLWLVVIEVCWFNPALKLLNHLYINAMEQRCDLQTITQHHISKEDYASTLLLSIKLSHQTISNPFATPFNGQALNLNDYKQRFDIIIKEPPILVGKAVLAFVFIASIMLFTKTVFAQLQYTQEEWRFPVGNIDISSHYGHIAKVRNLRPHRGIDLVDAKGSEILAAKTGKVIVADAVSMANAYGNVIVIQHVNGWQTLYAHLDEINVIKGQWVNQGDIIGKMGDTGKVTGTHLHFELAHLGQALDPLNYLKEK